LASGGLRHGDAPILSAQGLASANMVDPLPQALILTAIVISFGITAFLLGLALQSVKAIGKDDADQLPEDPL